MKQLNLYRIWEVMNLFSYLESQLNEQDIYVGFLGASSRYCTRSFDDFLEYYSFRIEGDKVCVFNNDPVMWEDYTTEDFSYVPLYLLNLSDEQVSEAAEKIKQERLKQQELDKIAEKERIKAEIERLQKRLNE